MIKRSKSGTSQVENASEHRQITRVMLGASALMTRVSLLVARLIERSNRSGTFQPENLLEHSQASDIRFGTSAYMS